MKPIHFADILAYLGARLGWPGLLGLALMLAALGLEQFQVRPLQQAGVALDARATRQERLPPPMAAPLVLSLADNLPSAAPEGVARLFAAAAHAGLKLEEGSYRSAGTGLLRRYQITLPLTGDYPTLRAFLAEALQRQPNLALDSLILTRDTMASATLKAKLSLTLYLREAP